MSREVPSKVSHIHLDRHFRWFHCKTLAFVKAFFSSVRNGLLLKLIVSVDTIVAWLTFGFKYNLRTRTFHFIMFCWSKSIPKGSENINQYDTFCVQKHISTCADIHIIRKINVQNEHWRRMISVPFFTLALHSCITPCSQKTMPNIRKCMFLL